MFRKPFMVLGIVMLTATAPALAASLKKVSAAAPYKKVSELVKLPDFLSGIGTLYVDPKARSESPFFAYDHRGKLVSTRD